MGKILLKAASFLVLFSIIAFAAGCETNLALEQNPYPQGTMAQTSSQMVCPGPKTAGKGMGYDALQEWFSNIAGQKKLDGACLSALEELYDDITTSQIPWEEELLGAYLHQMPFHEHAWYYGPDAKKVMDFLSDKDHLFRKLLLYFDPFNHAHNLEDIDNDGLEFADDPYPFNYSNGEAYFVFARTVIGDQGPHLGISTLNRIKIILSEKLNHDPQNIYILDPTTKDDLMTVLEEIFSKTTKKDTIFLDIGVHGDTDGKLWFSKSVIDHRKYEPHHASLLNDVFKDKDYAHATIIIGSCNGTAIQNAIQIDRSISIAESDGIAFAVSDIVLSRQIEKFQDLRFNSFVKALDEKAAGNNPRIKITGKINMPQQRKDWLIVFPHYKNPIAR